MKEGSFEAQIPSLDFESGDIRHIKTPDQLPDKMNLQHVPEHVLRSGVIESLISQNDDLMSRLTVALRRIGILEEKISDANTESARFKAKYDNLKDQVLILREQSRLLAERNRETETKNKLEDQTLTDLQEQIQILEIRYAELYTSTQAQQAKLEADLAGTARATARYQKYRQNIRRASVFIREELKTLRAKRQTQEVLIQDLRHNLAETSAYISDQAKEHKTQIASLTEAYENELRNLNGEIEMLMTQNRMFDERSQDLERTFNEKVKLENELIIAQRKEEEMRLQTAAEISDIQKALARHRNDAKELALELENEKADRAEKITAIETLTVERAKLTEQVETLQLLWRDQQNQVEKLNEQKNSLQRLNQELSIAINEYRREIRELKERFDAAEMKNAAELKAAGLKLAETQKAAAKTSGGVSDQNESNSNKNRPDSATMIKREDLLTPEIISKIDKVLTNLHVGR